MLLCLLIALPIIANGGTDRFVSKAGSDSNGGTSWNDAWLTVGKVNSSLVGGDDVYFGKGTWTDAALVPKSGTAADPTVYACSSATAKPCIYGGDTLANWVQEGATNRWVCAAPTSMGFHDGIFQGKNQHLLRQYTRSALTQGQWYYTGDSIVVYAYGGGDPDNYSMWTATGPAVNWPTTTTEVRHVIINGFHFANGTRSVIELQNGGYRPDSVVMRDCYIYNACGWHGVNPGCFYFGNDAADYAHYWRIVACTVGGAWATGTSAPGSEDEDYYYGQNSAGIMIEGLRTSTIDSCVFTVGGQRAGIYFKSTQQLNGGMNDSNIVVNNIFLDDQQTAGMMIYGNIAENGGDVYIVGNEFYSGVIIACYPEGYHCQSNGYCPQGPVYILFNTFYGGTIASTYYDPDCFGVLGGIHIRYNIFSVSSGSVGISVPFDTSMTGALSPVVPRWHSEFNQYYSPSSSYSFSITSEESRTWTTWRAEGYDTASVQQNPTFANPGGGDLTPANPVAKDTSINKTFFRYPFAATNYGAVQLSAAAAPVAAFSGTPTSGTAPLSVTFTDASTNTPTSWDWDWGDATTHGTTQNPTHEYSSAGTYTVTLTATNATGSDDEIKTDYITVSAPAAASDQLKMGNVKLGNVKLGGN